MTPPRTNPSPHPEPAADPAASPTRSAFNPASLGLDTATATPSGLTSGPEFPFLAPPQAADELGRLGPYRVLGVLGRGGMGVVFRGEDPKLRRHVALKVMLPQYAANPLAVQRFLREARNQAAVEHDHIIPIFQADEDAAGTPFIAMPLLKGQTLSDALRASPRPPVAEALRVAREMADGLAAAHDKGLIHRDIKPGNVWLEGDRRRVKILDFGLARAEAEGGDDGEPLTGSGAVVGTPLYMSPEQGRGEAVDHRTDLFALGVVLYQMTTGRLPFTGPTTMAILTSLAVDHPRPPADLVPDVPPRLNALILALLEKTPANRPRTARAVADELRRIEAGLSQTIVAIPLGLPANDPWAEIEPTDPNTLVAAHPSRPVKPPRRSTPAWVVGLAAAVVLLGGGAAAWQVVKVLTPKGTLVIELAKDVDPNVEVVVKKDGVTLHDKTAQRRIELRVGDYEIELAEANGLKLSTKRFTIEKDGRETVKVYLDPHRKPSPATVTAALPAGTVDLLALVDVKRDALTPGWAMADGKLVGGDGGTAPPQKTLQVRYTPPAEYDMTLVVERVRAAAGAPPAAADNERAFVVMGAGPGRFLLAFDWESGGKLVSNVLVPGPNKEPLPDGSSTEDYFGKGGPVRIACQVRRTAIAVRVNDRDAFRWAGDVSTLPADAFPSWGLPDKARLGVGVKNGGRYRVSEWTVTPAAGTPGPNPAPPPSDGVVEPPATGDPERRVAERVLALGGSVNLRQPVGWVTPGTGLPAGALKVGTVALDNNPKLTDADLAALKDSRWFTHLSLNNTAVTDEGVAQLKECATPVSVSLTDTKVTSKCLVTLARLPALAELSVSGTAVDDDGLAHLKDHRTLSKLLVSCKGVSDRGLVHLKGLPLNHLTLFRTGVTDAGLVTLAEIKGLTFVYLANTAVTAGGVAKLAAALPACTIEWDGGTVKPADPRAADGTVAGLYAWVRSQQGGVTDLRAAAAMNQPADEVLSPAVRDGVRVGVRHRPLAIDADLARFPGGAPITSLMFTGTRVGDAGVAHLKGCERLGHLDLANTAVTDAGTEHLIACKNLEQLILDGTPVGDAGVAHLSECPRLTHLGLAWTKVTDAGLATLAKRTTLRRLDVIGTKVTKAGVEKLAAALPGCLIEFTDGVVGPPGSVPPIMVVHGVGDGRRLIAVEDVPAWRSSKHDAIEARGRGAVVFPKVDVTTFALDFRAEARGAGVLAVTLGDGPDFRPELRLWRAGGAARAQLFRVQGGVQFSRAMPVRLPDGPVPLTLVVTPAGTALLLNGDAVRVSPAAATAAVRVESRDATTDATVRGMWLRTPTAAELANARAKLAEKLGPEERAAAFLEVHNVTRDALQAWAKALPKGYRPTWVSARSAGDPRFDAVATPAPANVAWELQFTTHEDQEQFHAMMRTHRPGAMTTYQSGAGNEMLRLWVKDGVGCRFTVGTEEYNAPTLAEALKNKQGFYSLAAFRVNEAVHAYECYFGPPAAERTEVHLKLSGEELAAKVAEYRAKGWRPSVVNAHAGATVPTFVAAFAENPANEAWDFSPGLTVAEYEAQLAERRAKGQRPRCVCSTEAGGGAVTYTVVWDDPAPRPVLETHGVTQEALLAWAAKLPKGYRPTWVSARGSGAVVFDAVATPVPGDAPWRLVHLPPDDDGAAWKDLGADGSRVALLAPFVRDGKAQSLALGVKDGIETDFWFGTEEFVGGKFRDGLTHERDNDGVKERWLPACLAAYAEPDGGATYQNISTWQPHRDAEWHPDLSAAELAAKVDEARKKGWRPHLVSAIVGRPVPAFVAVFTSNPEDEVWEFTPSLNAAEYEKRLAAGGRPRCVASHETDGKVTYTVVWDGVLAAADPNRRAAEYVLSVGGAVALDGDNPWYDAAAKLPAGRFRLTHVNLNNNRKVDDAGLAAFDGCSELLILDLGGTKVTDDGLRWFQGCTKLTELSLYHTGATGGGLAHFAGCRSLARLNLWSVSVRDDDLKAVPAAALVDVNLGSTPVTGAGLSHVAGWKSLQSLNLRLTAVGDDGLTHLAGLGRLRYVGLDGTKITDAGLKHLAAVPSLADVHLTQTAATKAGVEKLAAALPRCRIEWDGGVIEPREKPDPDRKAAEALHPHVTLTLKLPDGMTRYVKPADPLPAGSFTVLGVVVPAAKEFPPDFVPTVFLPAVEPLRGFVGVTDNLHQLRWTEADVERFTASPAAATVYAFKTGFPLTPKTLAALKRMPKLGDVGGSAAGADDALVKDLAGLPALTGVGLTGLGEAPGVTDAGLDTIISRPLLLLGLSGRPITPALAKKVAAMPKLDNFYTDHLGDDAAAALAASATLTSLVLTNAPLTDAGLARLRPLRLTYLGLWGTKVTKAGVEAFAAARPACKVAWDGGVIGPTTK